MRICVLGAGALGASIGGVLTEAGLDVCLVDTWREHVEAMARHGLRLREQDSERLIKVQAKCDVRGVGAIDLMIVLVKSHSTEAAVRSATSVIGNDTIVLSLQNGLGNEELIAEVVGQDRVLGGVTYVGGVLLAPGHVSVGRMKKSTYVGELDGRKTPRVNAVGALLNSAGIQTVVADDIYERIWSKLLVNVAVGPLSAVTGLSHGGMAGVEAVANCAQAAVAEAIEVARASGVKLPGEDPIRIWELAREGLPAGHKSSMLQDIERGQRTEIDFVNGAVVKWGEKCGVHTPVNRTLVAALKGLEHRLQVPASADT